MKNIDSLIRKVIKEESDRYMFFSNLEQMRRQCDLLLDLERDMVDSILDNGHDWAQDHIAEAKNNLDQVFDFLMNQTKGEQYEDEMINEESQIDEGKNKPTNPKLWARAKSMAKSKFKVYPSAYANGWAAKWYKKHGGGWRKTKK